MHRKSPLFTRRHASIVLPQLVIPSERALASGCSSLANAEHSLGNCPSTTPDNICHDASQSFAATTPSCSPHDSDYISEDSAQPPGQNDSRTSSIQSNDSGSIFDSVSGSDATSLLPPRTKSILRPRSPRLEVDYFTRRVSPFEGGTFTDSDVCDKKLSIVLGFEPMTDVGLDEDEWNELIMRGTRNNKMVSFGATTIFPIDIDVELERVEGLGLDETISLVSSGDDGDDEGAVERIGLGGVGESDKGINEESDMMVDEEAF